MGGLICSGIICRDKFVLNINPAKNGVKGTMPIPGKRNPGHHRKTWDECVKLDLTVCGLSASTTLKEENGDHM